MNRKITHPYLVLLLVICSVSLSFGNSSIKVSNEYENVINNNPTNMEDYSQAADPGDFIIRRKADFNGHAVGTYSDAQFKSDWKCCSLKTPYTTQIRNEDGKRVLANFYKQGTWGKDGGLNQLVHMNDSPKDIEEVYITYKLKFEDGFDWGLANKLPGVFYGTVSQVAGGGAGPDLMDKGASIRFLWRAQGDLQLYVYHHNMPGKYGDTMGAGNFARLQLNKWHEITMRVVSNDIGKANGIIQVWLDNNLVASVQNVEMRTASSPRFIEGIAVSTFMGGADSRFAPDHDQYMFMDDFHVWQYSTEFLNANPTVARGLKPFLNSHKLYTPLSTSTPAPVNTPPSVAITSPSNTDQFNTGQAVTINANASDAEGVVSKVEFYNNNTLMGTSLNAPFNVTLADIQAGTHTLTAKAFDEAGASTVSEPVHITVGESNSPPATKIITPVNNETFELGTAIKFLAEASDLDGKVEKVEFFVDRKLIASTTQEPYAITLTDFGVGTYRLTVRAFDDKGLNTVSNAVYFNVVKSNIAPTVAIESPAQNTSVELGTAIEITANAADEDGQVMKVEFFVNNALVGTANQAPYNLKLGDLTVGTYVLTAKAFDDKGATTVSEAVNINVVNGNLAPTVSIISPIQNTTVEQGTAIEITAEASDEDGEVVKVEFFVDNVHVGTATTNTYAMRVADLEVGTYSLTAKAFDEKGASTESEAINVNIVKSNVAPTIAIVSPTQSTTVELGNAIEFTAEAVDEDGQIVKVEFFVDNALVGTATQATYSITLGDLEVGTYSLTAKAFDEDGASTVSQAVNVNVVKSNVAPTVSIVSPAQNTNVELGTAIEFTAEAADEDGQIVKVEFFVDRKLIASTTHEPYALTLTDFEVGTYRLTVRAFDDKGLNTVSNAVYFNVVKSNIAPTVAIESPAQNTSVELGNPIEIIANAADEDGQVMKVEFFTDNALVGTVTAAPYRLTLADLEVGTYSLTAKAYDEDGASTVSEAVNVNVVKGNVAPTVAIVSPAQNTTLELGTAVEFTADAADEDGQVVKVEFFVDNAIVGTATAAPYSQTLADLEVGTYSLTAKAYDEDGANTVSEAVNVNVVKGNVAPTIAIVSPSQNETFELGSNVTLTAEAADADGEVLKVEIYKEKNLISTLTKAPYTLSLTDLTEGTHEFTARAYDEAGASTLSQAVTVIIAGPKKLPTVQLVSPLDKSVFKQGEVITLLAEAIANEGDLARVAFYSGDFLLGTIATAPYSLSLADLATGTYSFTAVAYNATGDFTVSAVVTVAVENGDPLTKVTLVNPVNNAQFIFGEEIVAKAVTEGGEVAKVEFYRDNTLVGSLTESPYELSLKGLAVGEHELSAVAYDKMGAFAVSELVTIKVLREKRAPKIRIVSPGNNASYFRYEEVTFETNVESPDANVAKIEYFRNNILIGSTDGSDQFTWRANTVGNLNIRAILTDEDGMTASSETITLRVRNNNSPTVTITSPADESIFVQGTSIEFKVDASDSDGHISHVEYYQEEKLIGSNYSAPFGFVWNEAGIGRQVITAKAYDDKGASTISEMIYVNVIMDEKDEEEDESAAIPIVPEVVIINPIDKQEFVHNSDIEILVMFQGSDESVELVEYYVNSNYVGRSSASPFGFVWKDAPVGNHTLFAKAIGQEGTIPTLSEEVTFTIKEKEVTRLEIVNPMLDAIFSAGSDIDIRVAIPDNGKIVSRIEYFSGNVQIGTANVAPFDFIWKKVNHGDYSLVARAVYSDGSAELTLPVKIKVVRRNQASVRLISPENQMEIQSGGDLELQVEVTSDYMTEIYEIEYLINGQPLVAKDDKPFNYIWKNILPGTYKVEARGKDKSGKYHYSDKIDVVAMDNEPKDLSAVRLEYAIGPNPTSDYLNVFFSNLDGAYDFTMRVVSMTGLVHKEFEIHVNEDQVTLDLTDVKNGTYVLQVMSSGNHISSTRFIKR